MKKIGWIALTIMVLSIACFYGFSFKGGHDVSASHEEKTEGASLVSPTPTSQDTSHDDTASVSSPAVTVQGLPVQPSSPASLSAKSEFAQKPKDLVVNFEVVNGYAVAYGDVVLGKPTGGFQGKTGAAEIKPPAYWEDGVIPYLIEKNVPAPQRIIDSLDALMAKTRLKFVPYEDQKDALVFVNGEQNCQSYLGRVGGVQPVFLSPRCQQPEITHELMHALGFVHEQSRTDRDRYVNILWDHIQPEFHPQFAIIPEPLMEPFFDSSFDPASIMMYDSRIFSVRPGVLPTMTTKDGGELEIPLRALSDSDIARINRLYPR